MVGTDTWVTSRWEAIPDATRAVQRWLGQLPPDVAEKIAWRNGDRTPVAPWPSQHRRPRADPLQFRLDRPVQCPSPSFRNPSQWTIGRPSDGRIGGILTMAISSVRGDPGYREGSGRSPGKEAVLSVIAPGTRICACEISRGRSLVPRLLPARIVDQWFEHVVPCTFPDVCQAKSGEIFFKR